MTPRNPFLDGLKKRTPALVASLNGDELEPLVERASQLKPDLVEIRLDLWEHQLKNDFLEKLSKFKERYPLPYLLSFRGSSTSSGLPPWWQDWHWKALSSLAAIDLEWNPRADWREIRRRLAPYATALIVSHHDFRRTPSVAALLKIARQSKRRAKADIVKMATLVKQKKEVEVLLEVCKKFRIGPIAMMGMGPWGPLSRLVATLFGSCLVYGYIGRAAASGQWPFEHLKEDLQVLYP